MKTIWFCENCIGKMICDLEDYERLIIKRIPRNGTECFGCYNPANYPLDLHNKEVKRLYILQQQKTKEDEGKA